MTRTLRIVILAALAAGACGCDQGRYLVYLLFGGKDQDVKAEFVGLADKNVAVVVYCEKSVLFEYPDVQLSISARVTGDLKKNVEKVKVVDPRRIIKYQDENIYWDEKDKTELGKALGADYVLFVTLVEYGTREPGSVNLYRGRITAQASLYKVGLPERASRVWQDRDIRVLYPEHDPTGQPRENDREIRAETERLVAEKLSQKFYDHKVPIK
jgi:hypothetical protein